MNKKKFCRLAIFAIVLIQVIAVRLESQTVSVSEKGKSAFGKTVMATTAHPLATKAAIEILQQGGNAVDAAVAAAFAIGVVEPDGSGLGGGGGMVVYLAKKQKVVTINYYPRSSSDIMKLNFVPRRDNQSPKAILVPGEVDGLLKALELYGTLPRSIVLAPAIAYAEHGFPVDETLAKIILDNVALLEKKSGTVSLYLRDGFPLAEGDTLKQPALAHTLRMIVEQGRAGFYEGQIAQQMVNEVTENGGAMTLDDLKRDHAVVCEPVTSSYRGFDIVTMDAPLSGPVVLETLNILEQEELNSIGHYSTSGETLHLMAEALLRSSADRLAYVADPDSLPLPIRGLLSKEYAKKRFDDIDRLSTPSSGYRKIKPGDPHPFEESDQGLQRPLQKRSDNNGIQDKFNRIDRLPQRLDRHAFYTMKTAANTGPGIHSMTRFYDRFQSEAMIESNELSNRDGHTTHLSVVDGDGNAVSLTQTLGTFFGSGLVTAGVLMNNAASNFSTGNSINALTPHKRPRSSISPTIILKDGKLLMTVGSPGAARIVAVIVQLIVNIIDFKMNVDEANNAPRFFCQKMDDVLHLESRIGTEAQTILKKKGHTLQLYGEYDLFFGGAQIILRDTLAGQWLGSADIRRGGAAMGY
jgi:gamma-glutamyltranspeptidase/glutathione hydrolase